MTHNRVIDAYSDEAWGDLPNFAGHFINYGFWEDIPLDVPEISYEARVTSSWKLYQAVIKKLNISNTDTVLEIGCGRGVGATYVAKHFSPAKIVGLDITPAQIKLANKLVSQNIRNQYHLDFELLDCETYSLPKNTFDKIYSIEVFQHIPDPFKMLASIKDALKKNGTIAISTYFLKQEVPSFRLKELFPLVKENQEFLITIDKFIQMLQLLEFTDVNIFSIGENVFAGYQRWISQQDVDTPCSYVYEEYYKENLIDYYIVTAKRT